jgi:carotenoid 1,2-hydratase
MNDAVRKPGPSFDQSVPQDGYAWWYVDALSDDGENGLTIIAFIGSVFSPYYKFARRRGATDPLNHCTINVALYRKRGARWAMTERPSHAVSRDATSFRVGPSGLHWDGTTLTIDIVETCMPIPRPLRGRVKVTPRAITAGPFVLNADGHHRWWPIAPHSRVEVEMQEPNLRWQGDGYLDHNAGDAPVENGFRDWQWARGITRDGAVIMYEGERRDGSFLNLARTFDWNGGSQEFTPPSVQPLKRARWGIRRSIRSERPPSVIETVVDAPFYARSVVSAQVNGENLKMMHESLSLDRFGMPIVQAMLPFRMPRARR